MITQVALSRSLAAVAVVRFTTVAQVVRQAVRPQVVVAETVI
jgi:hypothetical protein